MKNARRSMKLRIAAIRRANGDMRAHQWLSAGALTVAIGINAPTTVKADESGVSFWIPGFFGSLAAAPLQPGLSLTAIDYYDLVRAGGDAARAREITIHELHIDLNVNINARLDSRVDLGL